MVHDGSIPFDFFISWQRAILYLPSDKAKSGERFKRFEEDFPGLPPWAYSIGSDAAFTNYVHLCAHSILPINSVTHLTCALL